MAEKLAPSSGQFVLVIENVGPSFYFSGMRQRAAMLELRASIVAINPAPTNLAANELGSMGRSGVRVFDHSATMSRRFWSHSLALAKVKSRKQAIAIGLSEARKKGAKVLKKRSKK